MTGLAAQLSGNSKTLDGKLEKLWKTSKLDSDKQKAITREIRRLFEAGRMEQRLCQDLTKRMDKTLIQSLQPKTLEKELSMLTLASKELFSPKGIEKVRAYQKQQALNEKRKKIISQLSAFIRLKERLLEDAIGHSKIILTIMNLGASKKKDIPDIVKYQRKILMTQISQILPGMSNFLAKESSDDELKRMIDAVFSQSNLTVFFQKSVSALDVIYTKNHHDLSEYLRLDQK